MSDEPTELSYEQAREQLLAVVNRLESGGIGLAESMQLWERGKRLAASCQRSLDGARAKVAAAWEAARSADQDESARS